MTKFYKLLTLHDMTLVTSAMFTSSDMFANIMTTFKVWRIYFMFTYLQNVLSVLLI